MWKSACVGVLSIIELKNARGNIEIREVLFKEPYNRLTNQRWERSVHARLPLAKLCRVLLGKERECPPSPAKNCFSQSRSKSRVFPAHATKACSVSRIITPLILNIFTGWMQVGIMLRPLYTPFPGNNSGTHWIRGFVGPGRPSGIFGEQKNLFKLSRFDIGSSSQ